MKNTKLNQLTNLIKQYGYRKTSSIKKDESQRFNGTVYDQLGRKYFIKAVIGKDSYKYKSLYREAQITNYLSSLTKKVRINHNGYSLQVPEVAKIIIQNGFLCLITNYIEGVRVLNESSKTQSEILSSTLELVGKLSKKAKISVMQPYLKKYTKKAILFSLPVGFIKASVFSFYAFIGLTRVFWKSLPLLAYNNPQYGLVHSDINLSNLILQKNRIYLTDWEEAGWGINAYNAITPLCVHWQNPLIKQRLFEILQNNGQRRITIPLLAYRTLMLFNQRIKRDNKKRKRDMMIVKFLEA